MEFWPLILAPVGFLIGFPLLWSAVVGLISVTSGWRTLSAAYPKQDDTTAQWKNMCSAGVGTFGFGNYRNCLQFGRDAHYLHIKPIVFFAMFHPQISIPIADITVEGSGTGLFARRTLRFKNANVPVRISESLSKKLIKKPSN